MIDMIDLVQRLRPHLRSYCPGDEARVEPPEAGVAGWALEWLALADRYHRYRVEGMEHIPTQGPVLLVSYHALTVVDVFLLARRIYQRDGRVVRGLSDRFLFQVPGLRDFVATFGIVEGSQQTGLAILADGQIAGCMPGGGLEWSRSSAEAHRLRWGDHRGYARLAIRAGAPIIPTACPSADNAYLVPFDGWKVGAAVQRIFRLKRNIPIPIPVGLFGPLPFPVQLTQYVGAPIWPEVPPEAADDPKEVERLDARVRKVIEGFLERG